MRMARQRVDTRLIHVLSALAWFSAEGMMNPRAVLIHAMLSPVIHILARTRVYELHLLRVVVPFFRCP